MLLTESNVVESTINIPLASSTSSIAIYTYYLMIIFLYYLAGLINPIREIGKPPEYRKAIPVFMVSELVTLAQTK